MADHIRDQIRAAVVTLLTGLTTTGSNVFKARVYPLESADLPGLLIMSGGEESEPDTLGGGAATRGMARGYILVVEAVAAATANVDDTLDTIAKEVEIAIAADLTIGGLCKDVWLASTGEPELSAEGKKPHGSLRMEFNIQYRTTQIAPDVAA